MKVVHMTSVHRWNDMRIQAKMCRSLARAGHEVHLVVPREDGPPVEQLDGVWLHAVPCPRGRCQRLTQTVLRVWRRAQAIPADVYHFHDPELIPAGLGLKLLGRRVVYDMHEDLPKDILDKDWIPRWLRGSVAWNSAAVERLASRCLDGMVAATPSIGQRFPAGHTVVVQNFPILDELSGGVSVPFAQRPPWVAYVGGITRIRGLGEVVSAMGQLPSSLAPQLVLAGEISPEKFETELRQRDTANRVSFRGWQGRRDVAELLAQACAGVVTYLPVANHLEAQPNKLFEYMSAGLPVIASDFPLWRQIVTTAECGLLVDPEDPSAIAEAICWLLEHRDQAQELGRRGQQAVCQQYHWEPEAQALMNFYERVVRGQAKEAEPAPSMPAVDTAWRAASSQVRSISPMLGRVSTGMEKCVGSR
ncbi:MAG: glycosyltransferase family 4 protein [Planctomycetota bacterium]|nr:glycosyltransferase family 4 protein [Planctomycetota bacterium]